MNNTGDAARAHVVLSLRATPKGALHYDRGAPAVPAASPWPTSPEWHASPSDWTCVLEEVTSEMDRAKTQSLARLTRDWQRVLSLNGRSDELEVTLGPWTPTTPTPGHRSDPPSIQDEVQTPSPPAPVAVRRKSSPRLSPVPRTGSPVYGWTSPVDQQLRQAERARQVDRDRVVMAHRQRVAQVQAALDQASRDQYQAQSETRMADLARKTQERLRVEAEAEAERAAETRRVAVARQKAAEDKRRQVQAQMEAAEAAEKLAQAEKAEKAEKAQAAFQAFRSECQKWVELILKAEKALQASAAPVQAQSPALAPFLAQRKQDLPQLKQFLQTGTLPSPATLSQARDSHAQLERLLRDLAVASQQFQKEQAQAQAEAARPPALVPKTPPPPTVSAPPPVPVVVSIDEPQSRPTPMAAATPSSATSQLASEISASNRAKFDALVAFKANWLDHLRAFMSDPAHKSFRFSCQKAVNTPVNALNANSSSHLRQKLDHLQALLRGQGLEVTGQAFNASIHPMGIPFCKYILAKKLVDQGSDVISAKPDAAFGVAQVIVSLWAEFGDFGQLILATVYEVCPYLVPYHKQKPPEQDSTAYYQSLGYQLTNEGSLEKQDLYVKRMAGIARLFAAVTITALPKDQLGQADHPHGVGYAWCWLSSELNLNPVNDVTATLIQVILEVSGHKLAEMFGKMFLKVVVTLSRRYLPLIKKATIEGSGGPVERLETTLSKIMSTGQVEQPPGLLSLGFI